MPSPVRSTPMRVLLLAALAAAAVACSDDDDDNGGVEPPTTGSIEGSIAAGTTNVPGAVIDLAGPETGTVTTGNDGLYSFDELDPGSYTLTLTVPDGYELAQGETETKDADVTAGEVTTVDWSLTATGGSDIVTITAAGTSFSPQSVTVPVGTTVRWTATEGSHTVTPDNPAQPGAWASSALNAGETFEHTFTTPGTYDYHCQPHQSLGMTGTVIVQ